MGATKHTPPAMPTDAQAELLRDKYVLWERASREGSVELRDYNRRAAEALKAYLCAIADPLAAAREAFLAMIADAKRWDEDVDGEYVDGRPVTTIRYDLTTDRSQLEELIEALGIHRRFDETAGDAIQRALEAPPAVPNAEGRANG